MSLSILVLSEDSGQGSYETITALSRQMLRLLVTNHQPQRVLFQPLNSEQAKLAVRGNLWKSAKGPQWSKRQELLRTLANQLLEGERSFVFFHIDGDCAWADQAHSENLNKFDDFKQELRNLITMFLQQKKRPAPTRCPTERLLVLVPFWCIESWLYQNTAEAIRLCREHHGGQDEELFLSWQRDRSALDEEPFPKKKTCLRSQHNQTLAEHGYPADAVYQVGKSFAACVDGLLDCEPLCAALGET